MYDDLLTVHGKQEGTKRTTHSMESEPPLGFDSSYLKKVDDASKFMNNEEIKTWISSVSHHLKIWYSKCVCDPANEAHLRDAQSDPERFMIAVSQHEAKSLQFVRLAGKPEVVDSDFVLRTWKMSVHIARDGKRGGAFAWSKSARHMRYAAIMLLVTVIMDLTVNMGCFIRLFLGVHADLTAEDEQILLALGSAPASPQNPLDIAVSVRCPERSKCRLICSVLSARLSRTCRNPLGAGSWFTHLAVPVLRGTS